MFWLRLLSWIKTNPDLLRGIAVVLAFIVLVVSMATCDDRKQKRDQYKEERDTMRARYGRLTTQYRVVISQLDHSHDSVTTYRQFYSDCRHEQDRAKLVATGLREVQEHQRDVVSERERRLSNKDKIGDIARNLVDSHAIDKSRLPDSTGYQAIVTDSSLVSALYRSTEWSKLAAKQLDSCNIARSVLTAELETATDTVSQQRHLIDGLNYQVLVRDTAIKQYEEKDCGGFFNRVFCRSCRQLRRYRRK